MRQYYGKMSLGDKLKRYHKSSASILTDTARRLIMSRANIIDKSNKTDYEILCDLINTVDNCAGSLLIYENDRPLYDNLESIANAIIAIRRIMNLFGLGIFDEDMKPNLNSSYTNTADICSRLMDLKQLIDKMQEIDIDDYKTEFCSIIYTVNILIEIYIKLYILIYTTNPHLLVVTEYIINILLDEMANMNDTYINENGKDKIKQEVPSYALNRYNTILFNFAVLNQERFEKLKLDYI